MRNEGWNTKSPCVRYLSEEGARGKNGKRNA